MRNTGHQLAVDGASPCLRAAPTPMEPDPAGLKIPQHRISGGFGFSLLQVGQRALQGRGDLA